MIKIVFDDVCSEIFLVRRKNLRIVGTVWRVVGTVWRVVGIVWRIVEVFQKPFSDPAYRLRSKNILYLNSLKQDSLLSDIF